MQFSRLAMILLITIAVAGCKIRIVNPNTGSVMTESGAFSCDADEACEISVVDLFFDETFMAVPQPDYYFVGWKKKDKRLCGGRLKPCHIFTSAFEDNEILMSFLQSDEEFYLQPLFSSAPPITDVVKIGNRVWAQADLFLDLSWADISEVCPLPKGICDGQLNSYDVSGWVWASIDDVFGLLVSLGHPTLTYPPTFVYGEISSDWAPAFYDTGFRQTLESAGRAFIAWTSSLDDGCTSYPPCGITAAVVDRADADASDFVELLPIPIRGLASGRGAWLYRNASDL